MNGVTERDCAQMIVWSGFLMVIGVVVDQLIISTVGFIGVLIACAILWRME